MFEVVSIRRHAAENGPIQRTPNQSGVLRADLIAGTPGWLSDETYDVAAKVDEADLADWQKPEMTQTMLHAMLRAMLAEEIPVYDLVVAKGGPKFTPVERPVSGLCRARAG